MYQGHRPPIPVSDPVEQQRMEASRLRYRMLYGYHEGDVRQRMQRALGATRYEQWGPFVDLSANPFRQISDTLSTLYSAEPEVLAPSGAEDVVEAIADSGYWTLARRVQRDAIGLNTQPVRIGWSEEDGLDIRPVAPHLVQVEVHPRRPTSPLVVTEWSPDPDDPSKWVRYVYDPRQPAYVAFDDDGHDVSDRVLGGNYTGDNYPWTGPDGPILPWVFYSPQNTGFLWSPNENKELVEGSLTLMLLMSYATHSVKSASWSQRYVSGLEPAGAAVTEGGSASTVVTDPGSVLSLVLSEGYEGQPLIGQWSSPVSPKEILETVRIYEDRLIDAAIGAFGVSRTTSDVRSGYSLAVSRDAIRQLQTSFEPVFRRSDLELVGKVSAIMGGPSKGYRIEYQGVPKSPQEKQAELVAIERQVELGIIDRITAYQQLHPGLTRAEATTAVDEIARINRQYAA